MQHSDLACLPSRARKTLCLNLDLLCHLVASCLLLVLALLPLLTLRTCEDEPVQNACLHPLVLSCFCHLSALTLCLTMPWSLFIHCPCHCFCLCSCSCPVASDYLTNTKRMQCNTPTSPLTLASCPPSRRYKTFCLNLRPDSPLVPSFPSPCHCHHVSVGLADLQRPTCKFAYLEPSCLVLSLFLPPRSRPRCPCPLAELDREVGLELVAP